MAVGWAYLGMGSLWFGVAMVLSRHGRGWPLPKFAMVWAGHGLV